jgi:hypothetical protein
LVASEVGEIFQVTSVRGPAFAVSRRHCGFKAALWFQSGIAVSERHYGFRAALLRSTAKNPVSAQLCRVYILKEKEKRARGLSLTHIGLERAPP